MFICLKVIFNYLYSFYRPLYIVWVMITSFQFACVTCAPLEWFLISCSFCRAKSHVCPWKAFSAVWILLFLILMNVCILFFFRHSCFHTTVVHFPWLIWLQDTQQHCHNKSAIKVSMRMCMLVTSTTMCIHNKLNLLLPLETYKHRQLFFFLFHFQRFVSVLTLVFFFLSNYPSWMSARIFLRLCTNYLWSTHLLEATCKNLELF